MATKKKQSLKSLSSGRPPLVNSFRSMSRKASRTLINNHHQLEKRRHQAVARGDSQAAAKIALEIANLGGLDHYQKASLQGQSLDRGGDTSKVLLEWLPVADLRKSLSDGEEDGKLRMLEVGALSTDNACSKSGLFEMVRIDLNSQRPGIEQQDFMERPLPGDDTGRFYIISLSLVLNFVPEAAGRGDMLLRTLSFLRSGADQISGAGAEFFPSLFLVLPRSCLDNSRYFTDSRLEDLMTLLGYVKLRSKSTQKLAYSLWRRTAACAKTIDFAKKEVNPGRTRNNFVVTLKTSDGKLCKGS